MAVHWGPNQGKHKTIKHKRAYCTCPDGKCDGTWVNAPKKTVRNKNLEKRIKAFESGGGGKSSGKGVHFRHRPGSNKGVKGYTS